MKKISLLLILSLIISKVTFASLLSRVQLEEVYKEKVENYIQLFDKKAKASVRFEYKKINSNLPGTNLNGAEELPNSVELSDISTATVQIFYSRGEIPVDVQASIKKIIPIPMNSVKLDIQKFSEQMEQEEELAESIKKEDLKEISSSTIDSFINKLMYLFGGLYAATMLGLGLFHFRKMKEFKSHMSAINETLLSNNATPVSSLALPDSTSQQRALGYSGHAQISHNETLQLKQLHAFSLEQLQSVLTDCYWCERDAEAAWIWRRLGLEEKTALIKAWPGFKDYSRHLQNLEETQTQLFEDIYYLHPSDVKHLDNKTLADLIAQHPQIWGQLSSLRHHSINLSLELGLLVRADGHSPIDFDFAKVPASPLRQFELTAAIRDLSAEEEAKIEENPTIVPLPLRKKVPSLCWLAQREPEYIKETLGQFDARSLATAWIGPEKTLQSLEIHLSEKKLKALKSYLESTTPSRDSAAFRQLHKLGVLDEAA